MPKDHQADHAYQDPEIARVCDKLTATAAAEMKAHGASVPLILDRLLTYCAATDVMVAGSRQAARTFRAVASDIEARTMAAFEGEMPSSGSVRH